jgi:hypothetical protein
MKSLSALFLVALSLAFGLSEAHAQYYMCGLTLEPSAFAPAYGRYGHIYFYATSNPDCTGSVISKNICSSGATSPACGTNAQYSEAGLTNLFQALRSAQATQQQVDTYDDSCVGNPNLTTCTLGIEFLATH